MANLQKVIKVTQAQYDTLAAGGTVGSYTGLNDNYIYLVKDLLEYVTLTTDQEITGKKTIKDTSLDFLKTGVSGSASWQIEEDTYAQLSISRTYNGTKTKMWNFNGRDIIPETTATAKLGSSSKFIDTAYVNIINGNSNILFKTGTGNRFLFDNTAITPYVGQTLGTSAYKFGDIYTSGGLRDGNNANYKLVLPNSTSWSGNKTIATTDNFSASSSAVSGATEAKSIQINGTNWNLPSGGGGAEVTSAEFVEVVPSNNLTITFNESDLNYKTSINIYDGTTATGTPVYSYAGTSSSGTQTVSIASGHFFIVISGRSETWLGVINKTGGVGTTTISGQYGASPTISGDLTADGSFTCSVQYDY